MLKESGKINIGKESFNNLLLIMFISIIIY